MSDDVTTRSDFPPSAPPGGWCGSIDNPYYHVETAAKIVGCAIQPIYDWVARGKLEKGHYGKPHARTKAGERPALAIRLKGPQGLEAMRATLNNSLGDGRYDDGGMVRVSLKRAAACLGMRYQSGRYRKNRGLPPQALGKTFLQLLQVLGIEVKSLDTRWGPVDTILEAQVKDIRRAIKRRPTPTSSRPSGPTRGSRPGCTCRSRGG
jgi:hypothetical protein